MDTQEIIAALKNAQSCDNISLEALEALTERAREDMRRKEILSQHPIKQLPDNGKFWVRLDGLPNPIFRKSKEDLEDYIVAYYKEAAITIPSIFNAFLDDRRQNVEDTTWKKDIQYFNDFIVGSSIEKKPLNQLTVGDGQDFLAHCKEIKPDMRRKYWNNVKGTLNNVFLFAINKGYIKENPFRGLKVGKKFFQEAQQKKEEETCFTHEEEKLVIGAARNDAKYKKCSLPLGIVLLFFLGLRIGELCGLKWKDLERIRGKYYLHVQREVVNNVLPGGKTKGFKVLPHCKTPKGNRFLPLSKECMRLLEEIRNLNESRGLSVSNEDFIFLRKWKGRITFCTVRCFDPRLRRYCEEVGMTEIKSPHDIRRTVITNLYYDAHMPIKSIQKIAGHASQAQTEAYIRFRDDEDAMPYMETLCKLGLAETAETENNSENTSKIISFERARAGKRISNA